MRVRRERQSAVRSKAELQPFPTKAGRESANGTDQDTLLETMRPDSTFFVHFLSWDLLETVGSPPGPSSFEEALKNGALSKVQNPEWILIYQYDMDRSAKVCIIRFSQGLKNGESVY